MPISLALSARHLVDSSDSLPDIGHAAQGFGRAFRHWQRMPVSEENQTLSNQLLPDFRLPHCIGTTIAINESIMLNLIPSNNLIELRTRTWWPEKTDAQASKSKASVEESLPLEQDLQNGQESTLPPEIVYFAIELA